MGDVCLKSLVQHNITFTDYGRLKRGFGAPGLFTVYAQSIRRSVN